MSGLDIHAPFITKGKAKDAKDYSVFDREMNKSVTEKIKSLFAVIVAQTKTMMPDQENKSDLGQLWMSVANVMSQMANTEHVERNTKMQTENYRLGLGQLVGQYGEVESSKVHYDGTPATIRIDKPSKDIVGRQLVISSTDGQVSRIIPLDLKATRITTDYLSETDIPHGDYQVSVINVDRHGNRSAQPTYVSKYVDGISYDAFEPSFTSNGEQFSQVARWFNPEFNRKIYKGDV